MKGIDIQIEHARGYLETRFKDLSASFKAYNRAFPIPTNKQANDITPRIYVGKSEYKEILFDDRRSGNCFFYVPFNRSDVITNGEGETTVSIYFAVNLKKLYPSITDERATEYLHEDAALALSNAGWKINAISTGYQSWSEFQKAEYKDDTHPRYLCRFDCDVKYSIINCGGIPA